MITYEGLFPSAKPGSMLEGEMQEKYKEDWANADINRWGIPMPEIE